MRSQVDKEKALRGAFTGELPEPAKPPTDLPVPLAELLVAPAVDDVVPTPLLDKLVEDVLERRSQRVAANHPSYSDLVAAFRLRADEGSIAVCRLALLEWIARRTHTFV